jgi:hypothetical protein
VDGEGREVRLSKPALRPYLGTKEIEMPKRPKIVLPSDLETKRFTAPDGTVVSVKVVRADSPTFGLDLQAAFRSNVRRIREERRDRHRVDTDAAQA